MDEYDDFGYQVPLDYTEQSFAVPVEEAVRASTPSFAVERPSYAQELKEAAQRSYNAARLASFGARGELSSDLEDINPLEDFDYSPAAVDYMRNVSDYITGNTTGYNLTPMNVGTNRDRQTGAMMPLTNAELEKFAASPLENQFYANFNYSDPKGWDVGNLQFAPNQQYRLIDRKTGDVVYSGTGYEAGKNISDLAKGMFEKSGQKADWLIQEAAPGSNEWTQRYEHVPDVNGFNVWLKMVAPMLGGALAAPLGLAGNLGAAAGSAIGSAGAGIASGDSIGDILKSAALSGISSYAAGELFNKLGAGPKGGSSSGGGGSGGGGGTGGGVPATGGLDEIVVTGLRGASPAVLGSLVNSFIPTVTTNPITGEMTLNKASQVPPEVPPVAPTGGLDEIVVTGASGAAPSFGSIAGGLANAFVPTVTTNPITGELEVKQPEPAQQQEQTDTSNPNEIVVTGTGANSGVISGLGGALANLPSTTPTTGPEPRRPDYGDKVEEQPQDQTGDEIVVTGTGTTPAAVSGLGAAIANAAATSAEQPSQDQTQQNTDDEIVVTGTGTQPGAVSGLAGAIADAAATSKTTAEAEKKGGLDTMDKIRLAAIAAGLISDAAGGGSGGAKLPSGFGARNPIYSAKLPTPGVNGAFAVGGLGGGTMPMSGDLTQFGMGNIPRAAPTQVPQYGGVNPPGFNTQTWDWLGPQSGPAKNIMDQLAVLPSSAAPAPAPEEPVKKAMGGYAVGGPGDGRSDEIPALLSDGEYVIDAETVALLGNGSNKAGAKQLDKFRANIRKHKGRQLARGKFSVKAKQPDAYLSGGR